MGWDRTIRGQEGSSEHGQETNNNEIKVLYEKSNMSMKREAVSRDADQQEMRVRRGTGRGSWIRWRERGREREKREGRAGGVSMQAPPNVSSPYAQVQESHLPPHHLHFTPPFHSHCSLALWRLLYNTCSINV